MKRLQRPVLKIMGLIAFSGLFTTCSQKKVHHDYVIDNQSIIVDGNITDWQSVESVSVRGEDHLWIGEGLPEGEWEGNEDLSFDWKAAHHNGKLFFLFQVRDDKLSDFNQAYAWLNDCIEIHLDHQNLGGDRIIGIGPDNSLEDRFDRRLRGHEMQFLASSPPKAFVDDTKNIYYTDSAQTELFKEEWHGDIAARQTDDGYLIELGFAVPNFYARSGQTMGLDLAICDDDGEGRKSLLVWSGYQGSFWLTMDNFKKVVLN